MNTSWFWLHIGHYGHCQQGASPEATREQAEQYGKAKLQDDWLMSVPQPKRNTFMSDAEASAMAEHFRVKFSGVKAA